MVTIRSSEGMNDETTFRRVVLPVPVPPLMRMFRLPRTQASRNSNPCSLSGAELDQIPGGEGLLGELPDRQHGTVDGQGRDHGVDPTAVRESGVDQGRRLIDPAADGGHDLLDHLPQVLGTLEVNRDSVR